MRFSKLGLKVSFAVLAAGALFVFVNASIAFVGDCRSDGQDGATIGLPMLGSHPPCKLSGLLDVLVLFFSLSLTVYCWPILFVLVVPTVAGAWIDLYRYKFR